MDHGNRRSSSGFTLIELLVVIAIIAILSIVVILVINPAELLRQSRDTNRLSDMDTFAHALGLYTVDQASASGYSFGSAKLVYVSIPDLTATSSVGDQCQGLGLPTLPALYTYHCAASSTFENVDGTGWFPINFKSMSEGAPMSNLPFDPTNQSSSRLYYAYATNGSQYEFTTAMESSKYKLAGSNDVVSTDDGTKPSLLEKGTNLALEPLEYGDNSLVLYWTMDEGTGTAAYDYSGNNEAGSWSGTAAGTSGYYSPGVVGPYAGTFSGGVSNYISTSFQYSLTASSNFTWSAWMDISTSGTVNTTIIGNRYSAGGTWIKVTPSGFEYGNGKIISYNLPLNSWNLVTVTKSGSAFSYYLNGTLVATGTSSGAVTNEPFFVGGDPNYSADGYITGLVDDVRLYTRALSATEVKAIYTSQ